MGFIALQHVIHRSMSVLFLSTTLLHVMRSKLCKNLQSDTSDRKYVRFVRFLKWQGQLILGQDIKLASGAIQDKLILVLYRRYTPPTFS